MLSNTSLKSGFHKSLSCTMLMYFDDPVSLTLMIPFTILKSSIMPSFFLPFTKLYVNIGKYNNLNPYF